MPFYGRRRRRVRVYDDSYPRCQLCGHEFLRDGKYLRCPDHRRPLPDQRLALDAAWQSNWEGVRIDRGSRMVGCWMGAGEGAENPHWWKDMPRGAPSREQAEPKIDYRRWIEFRAEVDRLRAAGMSWTQISKAAKKDNNGWAASAYEHRGIVIDRDVELLRAIETDKEEDELARKRAKVTRPSTPQEVQEFVGLAEEMERIGWSRAAIAEAAGYADASPLNRALRDDGTTPAVDRLQQLRAAFVKQHGQVQYEAVLASVFQKKGWTEADDVAEEEESKEAAKPWPPVQVEPSSALAVREHEVKPDPWAWLDEVYEGLFQLAVMVDEHEQQFLSLVPESFRDAMRGPFREKREVIEKAMDEFRR